MQTFSKLTLACAMGLTAIIAASAQAQVAGDECTNALTANVGINTSNTTSMSPSANAPLDESCTLLDWGASKDVWFVFNAVNPGWLDLDFCASGYDTSFVVYKGTCAGLTRIACDDDSCPTATDYQSYKLGIPVVSAGNVYIRVGGWNAASGAVSFMLTYAESTANCSSTASCGVVHAEPGCDNQLCCEQVCAINPLCCEIGWDAMCVQAAVETCGYFVYTCVAGGPANNCATSAQVVSASSTVPFNTTGATVDGPNHACAGSANSNIFADVWYKVASPANGDLRVSTCGTTPFDSKIAIYDMGTTPASYDYNTLNSTLVACNDDGTAPCLMTDGTTPYASDVTATAAFGHSYLVRLGGYSDTDIGSGTITFTVPTPCALPSSTSSEAEACGADSNGGCDEGGTTVHSQAISTSASVGGTFWADADVRDVDWYTVDVAAGSDMTVSLYSRSNAVLYVFPGDPCSLSAALAVGAGSCPTAATGCLNAGVYSIAVATAGFSGNPCGNGVYNNYVLTTSATPAKCPMINEECTHPVDMVVSQNNGLEMTNYGFNCLLWCGTNESTFTVGAQFARSFPGLNAGSVGCVSFAYANMNELADGTLENGTPRIGTIGIYRDTNGGAPINVGADLVLIDSSEVLLIGGFSTVTWNIDAPIDLSGNLDPIVVVFEVPENGGCDVAANGILGGIGNNLGATAPYYERSLSTYTGLCVEAAFIANADPVSQWICTLGVGSAAVCPADFDGSGTVDAADLATLLNGWGSAGATDLDGNDVTDAADLASVLNAWGACL